MVCDPVAASVAFCPSRREAIFQHLHPSIHSSQTASVRRSSIMRANDSFHIAVLPGDGIGPEVMAPALDVLKKVAAGVHHLDLRFTEAPAGADHYRATGTALPDATIKLCELLAQFYRRVGQLRGGGA